MPKQNNAHLYDGMKSVPLSEYDPEYTSSSSQPGAWEAYASVAYAYKACQLRAQAVARLPYGVYRAGRAGGQSTTDLSEQPMIAPLKRAMSEAVYRTELALCVYGRAYWLKDANNAGYMTPRWLLPTSIEPRYEYGRGLVRFDRYTNERSFMGIEQRKLIQTFDPDELVYFWLPSLTSELGYGVAPMAVALGAAGVLLNLDRFSGNFFQRGAIKATLLQVDGNPAKSELQNLETWWKRMIAGVHKAWASVAIRASVNPVTIGDGLKDIRDNEISERRRQDIAAALQVPYSMINSNGVNRAVSDRDTTNFYETLVIPQSELVARVINDQFLQPIGLAMRLHPEKLEIMQQREVEKAEKIRALTGGQPVITTNEARDMLGYGPMPEDPVAGAQGDQAEIFGYHLEQGIVRRNEMRERLGLPPEDDSGERARKELRASLQIVEQATRAGLPLRLALSIAGLDRYAAMLDRAGPAPEPPEQPEQKSAHLLGPDQDTQALQELFTELQMLMGVNQPQPQITPADIFGDAWWQAHEAQPGPAEQEPGPETTGANESHETEQAQGNDTPESPGGPEASPESPQPTDT